MIHDFEGKKVTLMGLGLLGRGIGDAKFFASHGAELIVTDLKTDTELAPAIEQLKEFPGITYHLGGHTTEDFENRDLVIKANNAPLDSPFIAHAREHGIPVEMDASLFVKLCARYSPQVIIVGVTGTRGKSTTTHLIYETAQAAGKKVHLGGNERDIATLPLLETTGAEDVVVLELDSWQLQGFAEAKISPHIAVWTNFMPDHMNYYRGDMDRYFEDKAAIARWQTETDIFITTPQIKAKIESRFGPLKGRTITDIALPEEWIMALPGEHNRQNAAYATAVARCLGISDDVIKSVLKSFSALPGRLEFLCEKEGVTYYNDSNATTPEAVIAALKALQQFSRHPELVSGSITTDLNSRQSLPRTTMQDGSDMKKNIILIAGGNDKDLAFQNLAEEIGRTVKSAVLFGGKATEKLKAWWPQNVPLQIASDMKDACEKARAHASAGDIILLSPGATSFGLFKHEYDRADQFKNIVLGK